MEISPLKMALLLLYAFWFGMAVGVLYDANRIARVFLGERYAKGRVARIYELELPIIKKRLSSTGEKKTGRWLLSTVVFIGDMVCITVFSIGITVLNYSYNYGEFRMFTLVGAAVGFLLYFNTVGRLVMMLSEPLVHLIKYLILAFFIILGYPLAKIVGFCVKIIKKAIFLYTFTLEKREKKLYNIREEVYLLEMSKNGFFSCAEEAEEE